MPPPIPQSARLEANGGRRGRHTRVHVIDTRLWGAAMFMTCPIHPNPFAGTFCAAVNFVIFCTVLIQIFVPSAIVVAYIFLLPPKSRLQLPGNLVLPATALLGPGIPILIMALFGIWWGFVWNAAYSIGGALLLTYVLVPKSHELYATATLDKLQLGDLISLPLTPRVNFDLQGPLTENYLLLAVPFGILGILIPFLTQLGEPFAAILVLGSIFLCSWAIPLAIVAILNAPDIHNHVRVPLIATLAGYYASATLQISPLIFLIALAAAGGYVWWWREHHPYLKMLAAHARCKELHATAQILSVDDFLKEFQRHYRDKWGFDPSTESVNVAANLFIIEAVREIPPLPDMPPFQPTYSPGQDITHRLVQLEAALRDLPVKTNQLVASITNALDAYTAAVPRPNGASVFTIAAWEMVPDLPALVETLGTAFPNGFNIRASYERNRDYISEQGLGVKAYESGERIEPEAYANV